MKRSTALCASNTSSKAPLHSDVSHQNGGPKLSTTCFCTSTRRIRNDVGPYRSNWPIRDQSSLIRVWTSLQRPPLTARSNASSVFHPPAIAAVELSRRRISEGRIDRMEQLTVVCVSTMTATRMPLLEEHGHRCTWHTHAFYLAVLGLSVASFGGCASTSFVRDQAARDLRCPADDLSVELQGEARQREVFAVSGCGLRASYLCLRTGSMESICKRQSLRKPPVARPEQRVREKAAGLLECDAGALTVERGRLPGRFKARGCGKSIRYECASRSDCCAFSTPGVEPLTAEASLPPEAVEMSQHGASRQEIEATIRGADPKLWACFQAGLSLDPALGGVIESQFLIAPDGSVKTVVLRSSLGQGGVEACVRAVMKGLRFPPPESGGIVVVVDFPVVFLPNALPESACP